MTDSRTLGQSVPKEGLFLMDGIEGLRSLPKHSVDTQQLGTKYPHGPQIYAIILQAVRTDLLIVQSFRPLPVIL